MEEETETIAYRKGMALACRYLSMKSMHSNELGKKLQEQGIAEELIGAILLDCQSKKWLNDQEFCARFVEKLSKQGKSEIEISLKARQRGIPIKEITPHLQQNSNSQSLALLINKRYKILYHPEEKGVEQRKARDKAIRALLRRGFSMNDIYSVLRDYTNKTVNSLSTVFEN